MPDLETSSSVTARETASPLAALNAVRTSLKPTQSEPASRQFQQADADKPNDVAVAMRLAGEAIATASKAAETELRKTRELLAHAETQARRAEDRASRAEQRVAEWEKMFCKIRDDISEHLPQQQRAA